MANAKQLEYVRGELTNIVSQLNADNGKSTILNLVGQGKSLSAAREALGEQLDRTNVENLATGIVAAVAAHNAGNQLTVQSVADFMAGFDAAVAEDNA